jgi:hypothetical protein
MYIDIPDWKLQYTRQGLEVPADTQEVCVPAALAGLLLCASGAYSFFWANRTPCVILILFLGSNP